MKPVRQALARLEEGSWLGLFPEGRINKQPEEGLLPFDTGAAFFAFKSGAPVYPVFIHDAPRGETVFRAFFRRTRVRVTFGEPILLREMFAVEKPDLPTLQAAAEHLREVLTQLGEDCWFAPAADGGDVSGPSATDSANH